MSRRQGSSTSSQRATRNSTANYAVSNAAATRGTSYPRHSSGSTTTMTTRSHGSSRSSNSTSQTSSKGHTGYFSTRSDPKYDLLYVGSWASSHKPSSESIDSFLRR